MLKLAFLRRLVVIRGRRKNRINSGPLCSFLRLGDGVVRGVRGGSCDDGHATRSNFDRHINHAQPFIVRERWGFASCAAGNQEINSRLNLPRNQISERRLVQRSILMKRCDERRTASAKLHENKITRIGKDGKRVSFWVAAKL